MDYKKPQSTLVQGGTGIYPLTTADQVILADGSRLEKDGKIGADSAANSVNSAKLGGKAPEYYIQPRNLLDNSDFTNPVNQRGETSYEATNGYYNIDRWVGWRETPDITPHVIVQDGYITVETGAKLQQKIASYKQNTIYTAAAKRTDGTVLIISGMFTTDEIGEDIYIRLSSDGRATIGVRRGDYLWAALYEGSYTADTLPPYVPKGYAAELAECMRYFERLGSTFSDQIGNIVYVVSGAKSFVCSLQCSRKRISHPSVSINGVNNYRLLLKDATNASTYSAAPISSFDDITIQEPFISFRVNMAITITQNSWIQLQRSDEATAAYIDVSADL